MRWVFLLILIIFLSILFYKNVEKFIVDSDECDDDEVYDEISDNCVLKVECDEDLGEFYNIETNTCVNRLYYESDHVEQIPEPVDEEDEEVVEYIKPDDSITMDERDIFVDMCPRDYNIKQIKLREKISRSNQIPGYTSHITFDAMRRIPDPDKPFPVDADFFKN